VQHPQAELSVQRVRCLLPEKYKFLVAIADSYELTMHEYFLVFSGKKE